MPQTPKIGRNDPCPCGSGLKYKRCCEGKMISERAQADLFARPYGAPDPDLEEDFPDDDSPEFWLGSEIFDAAYDAILKKVWAIFHENYLGPEPTMEDMEDFYESVYHEGAHMIYEAMPVMPPLSEELLARASGTLARVQKNLQEVEAILDEEDDDEPAQNP